MAADGHQPPLEHQETGQNQADRDEQVSIARYLALRALWAPCWGAGPKHLPRRSRR